MMDGIDWEGWPTINGYPLEKCEIKQTADYHRSMARFAELVLRHMAFKTIEKPSNLEVDSPQCCGVTARYCFTDSGGIAFFQCSNCSRYFHLGEGVLERMKKGAK